jgi:glycosyltransferase involved in cell wall biosynthesis
MAVKVALDASAVPARLAGAGRYVAELARRLPSLGVTTTLVTRRDDAARWEEMSPGSVIAPIVPSARAPRLIYEAWSLGASAAAREAQVWHAPHYTMPRRGTTPTVVTIHDLTFFTNPEWHERSKVVFFRRAIAYSARHARVLICVSDFTARQLDEFVPDHAPVVVAPHGVDLVQFSPNDVDDATRFAVHGYRFGVPYVLFVGTIEPRKGLDVLLAAFAQLAANNPTIELWIAGQPGWAVQEFETLLAVHGSAARIRRMGFVDEAVLPALLRQARVVAYPSRGEGFGLPVLEALACGAMVVTSKDTVMAEVAGTTAALVGVGDANALAGAIDAATRLGDADRARLSRAGRERAKRYTWDASMAQHLIAYERASAEHL